MKKIIALVFLLISFSWLNPVSAAKPNLAPEFPDASGTYDVPNHPELKVKVFVHNPKGKTAPPAQTNICADSYSIAKVGPVGWHMEGAWIYKVNPAMPSTINGNINDIIFKSFNEWMSKSPELSSKVTLQQGANTAVNRAVYDKQNIIAWGKTSNSALGVTYTWYNKTTGIAVESDTILNQKLPWSWNECTASTYDAQNILTHELGHWFGLNDHYTSDYKENTMFGYGAKGETKKDTLTQGDIDGINDIY